MATADLMGSLMTGDRFLPAVAVGLGVVIVLLCLQLLKTLSAGGFEAELHGYQKDFLDAIAKARGQPSAAAALELLVGRAMSEPAIYKEIFDDFHCVHCKSPPIPGVQLCQQIAEPHSHHASPAACTCARVLTSHRASLFAGGSKDPAEWIAARKGKKEPYSLPISSDKIKFLSGEILLKVGPPGPQKAIIPGPKRADASKAVRCCVDWAIKHYGALATGTVDAKKTK
eukprot:COSAG01_NODE_8331_length_2826_cov_1.515952_3_plen_228_part_00